MYKLPLWIFVGTKHISIYFPFERHFKVDDFSFSLSVGSCSFPNLRSPNRQGMVAEDANVQTHILGPNSATGQNRLPL